MAVGDDAVAARYPLVPGDGEEGKVKYGNREINRTRDFVAQLKTYVEGMIDATWGLSKGGTGATTKAGARTNFGITSGTGNPTGGEDGDIYFKIV